MLITLLNWIYITFLSVSFGLPCYAGTLRLFSKQGETRIGKPSFVSGNSLIYILLCGITALTVYAQFFSLFGAVGSAANILALFLSLIFLSCFRKALAALLPEIKKAISCRDFLICLAELCLIALLSARAPDIEDSYYYHIPTIEWIHCYGTVRGLSCLMPALGFNGSLHALSALVDWSLFGNNDPLHTVPGYLMAVLLLFSTRRLLSVLKKPVSGYSPLLHMVSIILVLIGTAWISSPVLDMPLTCLIWIILILWCEIIESSTGKPEASLPELILLCFFIVFSVTIKLSAAIFVLLALYPAYLMIKEHRIRQIFMALGLGLFIAAPFLIRNVLISGWLLFPLSLPDLSPLSWKLPKDQVKMIAGWATNGSRDPGFLNRTDLPWIAQWFIGSSLLKRFLYIVTFLMFIAGISYILKCIKKKSGNAAFLFYYSVLLTGLVYWFFAAPDTRFGWFYIFPILVFPLCRYLGLDDPEGTRSSLVSRFGSFFREKNTFQGMIRKALTVLCVSCLALYGCFYLYRSCRLVLSAVPSNAVYQTAYNETQEAVLGEQSYQLVEKEGVSFYQLAKPGHKYFPATITSEFRMFGDSPESGFYLDSVKETVSE